MITILCICCLQSVFGIGPPGVQPPITFEAEQWYPSNLPTVMPPWKIKAADVNKVQLTQTTTTPGLADDETDSLLSIGPPRNLTGGTTVGTDSDVTTVSTSASASEDPPEIREEVFRGSEEKEMTTSAPETVLIASTESSLIPEVTNSDTPIGTERGLNITAEVSGSTEQSNESTMEHPSQNTSGMPASDKPNCTDIFLVLDSSGNVLRQYEKQKHLISNILVELGDGDRHYGLMTYAGKTRQRINVPPHSRISKQLFMRKLAKARFLSGVTATGSALKAVANLKFPHSTDIIVVTDGFSFDSVEKEAEQLRALNGIRIFVTGNYFPVLRDVLTSIAGDSQRVMLGNQSISRLTNLLKC